MELAGKVALVTGGASGIGEASARALAAHGARVLVADVDDEGAARVAAQVGGRAVHLDVADPHQWQAAVASVTASEGALQLVHLNAGISGDEVALTDLTDEHYRRVLGVNLDGVVFGLRATLPLLRAAGGGAVVVTSSMAGLSPYAPDPVYTVTKQAVVGLVRGMAPELALGPPRAEGQPDAPHITINAVCPGLVDTPMMAAARDLFVDAGLALLDPAEVAAVVVDLLAGTRTGQAIAVLPGQAPEPWMFSGPSVLGQELVEIRHRSAADPRG